MVINEAGFFSHSSQGNATFSRCRRWLRRKKNRYYSVAAITILCVFIFLVPLYIGRFLVDHYGRASYDLDDILRQRRERFEHDDFDGSSHHSPDHGDDADNATSKSECVKPGIENFPFKLFTPKQRKDGAVVINVLVTAYMFAALGIICEDYFMPSLEIICDVLNLSEDVAGATFMAIGGSAPELFSSLIAVFVTHDDIGVGTIVGSAVFNLLCVIGLCGLLAGQVIVLSCWPLIRDSSCYMVCVVTLVLVVRDGVVTWKDSVILLALYIAYCIVMYFNPSIEKYVAMITPGCCKPHPDDRGKFQMERGGEGTRGDHDEMELQRLVSDTDEQNNSPMRSNMNGHVITGLHSGASDDFENGSTGSAEKGVQVNLIPDVRNRPSTENDRVDEQDGEQNQDVPSPFELPEKGSGRVTRVLAYPIIFAFYITVPDCRTKRWERCYVMTFVIALVWIGFLTYVLVWMVSVIGDTLSIPSTVMGLTLLAAGASTPDTILSIIASRGGYGDMAISHSIGSNLFDILIGLGFPWFLNTAIVDRGSNVIIDSGAIYYVALLLVASVFLAILLIVICRFRLGKPLGVLFIVFYVVFIVLSILFEMNILIPGLTLPPCN